MGKPARDSLNPLKRVMLVSIRGEMIAVYAVARLSQSPQTGHVGFYSWLPAAKCRTKRGKSQSPQTGHVGFYMQRKLPCLNNFTMEMSQSPQTGHVGF